MPESNQGASPILLLEWWKPVVGYEGLYEVSNVGNVCRIRNPRSSRTCHHLTKTSWAKSGGRLYVSLTKNNRVSSKRVHKLMADAFLGGTPPGMTVNHIDHCFKNNRLSNFEFLTALDNWWDAYNNGLMPRGEKNGNSKLSEEQAKAILDLHGKASAKTVGNRFGVAASSVLRIWNGECWAHLQSPERNEGGGIPAAADSLSSPHTSPPSSRASG